LSGTIRFETQIQTLLKMMKKITAFLLLLNFMVNAKADEGMWLPILLGEINIEDMRSKGFRLNAEDIYSVNKSSMKDAVVSFGGGCTGEMISGEGLLLTNHHCGFTSINALSTIESNYLRDGFWSYNKKEEIPCPGLTVTFIISMHDVTDSIIGYLTDDMDENSRNATIQKISASLQATFTEGTHYGAIVRPFYYGTEFYLFVTETFTDIRLVGAPPSSVGNFGGETDNWVWPRHTGDFSLFRIYAGADNKPAAYSESNVPFKPRYFFPISIKGVKENDFTMVYGFPGRTQEYLPSFAVDLLISETNPNRIGCRDARLAIMDAYMSGNDTITLMYASKAKGLANAYKKWKGEMAGLKANNAVEKKQEFEAKFQNWANTHVGKDYRYLLDEFEKSYTSYRPYSELMDFTSEAFFAVEVLNYAGRYRSLAALLRSDTTAEEALIAEAEKLLSQSAGFYKNYSVKIDRDMFATMLKIYSDRVAKDLQSPYFKSQVSEYNSDFEAWADAIFKKSIFADQAKIGKVLTDFSAKKGKKIMQDPVFKLYEEVANHYNEQINTMAGPLTQQINGQMRRYMTAQRMMQPDNDFYPDANSTLRIAYGNAMGYQARDAVYYTYQTTDAGIEQKYIAGDEEFDMPEKLMQLMSNNDFGRYADANGSLPIAFIASNHTTGGNSGSPVINANGELIGTNYDRVWEGTMSDVMYDINRCRNISLDIRYTLFVIDKYAGAKNLIDEMWIVE
jgi:hypothetical protein